MLLFKRYYSCCMVYGKPLLYCPNYTLCMYAYICYASCFSTSFFFFSTSNGDNWVFPQVIWREAPRHSAIYIKSTFCENYIAVLQMFQKPALLSDMHIRSTATPSFRYKSADTLWTDSYQIFGSIIINVCILTNCKCKLWLLDLMASL